MAVTLHLDAADPADIARAAAVLRAGGLVAFATETVYGLGANALSAEAVAGIFAAKERPSWDPVIVHLAFIEQVAAITDTPLELASRVSDLASAFWPGPLTLLLPRNASVPDAVTAGRPLVGVRIPAHPAAHALLAAAGVPIAAPSANRFGHTSPTTAAHVLADLDGRIDAVLDAGATSIGVESTVLDPTQTPMVLYRPGAVTAEQLTAATGVAVSVFVPDAQRAVPESLPSPGVGIRHYAPRATLRLTEPTPSSLTDTTIQQLQLRPASKIGVLLPLDFGSALAGTIAFDWAYFDDPETLAARLFAGLRSLDDQGVEVILAPLPPPGGLYDAIRDRLEKAAKPK